MTAKILVTPMDGTPKQICFADHAGDFSPTAANDLRITTDGTFETDCQLSMASVANLAARQSAKVDLGAKWAESYRVRAALEFAATPVAGETVEFYWAPSQASTAANGNPGSVSGGDLAYSGYSSNISDAVKQLELIGVMVVTAQATGTVQVAEVSIFSPAERYGSLVVKNESDAAIHSDDIECNIVFDPIIRESQ